MGEVASTLPPNMHPQHYITAITQKYNLKGIFYLDLWPIAPSQVILTDPDLMNKVTVTRAMRVHSYADDFLAPIVGRNVIATSNGSVWKKTHNAMAPAFTWSHVKNLVEVMADETLLFRDTLDRLADSGEVFSMEETAAKLIFDVIARIVFNFPLHAQTKGSPYLADLREMIRLVEAQLSFNPWVRIKAFFKRQIILRRLNASITAKIMERFDLLRREKIVPSRKDPFSILDLMLREQLQQESPQSGANQKRELSRDYLELLITNVKGLLVGGHGTTTDTLCYIYMLLSKSPDTIQKLREEHDRIFAPNINETLEMLRESPHKLNDLEYTSAVIKETLRMFPVGFGLREADEGASIQYNGQSWPIDKHLAIVPIAHTLHYDPTVFPDPSKFEPERFTGPDPVPRHAFRTFGRGPRACPGQNLATDELRVILLLTIRDYNFECADLKPNAKPRASYTDLDLQFGDIIFQELGLEAKPRGGMMMRVSKN